MYASKGESDKAEPFILKRVWRDHRQLLGSTGIEFIQEVSEGCTEGINI